MKYYSSSSRGKESTSTGILLAQTCYYSMLLPLLDESCWSTRCCPDRAAAFYFTLAYAGGSSSRLDRDLSTLPSASAWLYQCCTDVWKDWLEQKVRRDPADPECIRCRTPIAGIVCMQGIRLLHYGCLNRGGSSSYRDSWHSHVFSPARALHGHRLSDDYCPLQMLEEGEEEETN